MILKRSLHYPRKILSTPKGLNICKRMLWKKSHKKTYIFEDNHFTFRSEQRMAHIYYITPYNDVWNFYPNTIIKRLFFMLWMLSWCSFHCLPHSAYAQKNVISLEIKTYPLSIFRFIFHKHKINSSTHHQLSFTPCNHYDDKN